MDRRTRRDGRVLPDAFPVDEHVHVRAHATVFVEHPADHARVLSFQLLGTSPTESPSIDTSRLPPARSLSGARSFTVATRSSLSGGRRGEPLERELPSAVVAGSSLLRASAEALPAAMLEVHQRAVPVRVEPDLHLGRGLRPSFLPCQDEPSRRFVGEASAHDPRRPWR